VREDVDLELLDHACRDCGQRGVDLLELLERDAFSVGQRRRRRVRRGREAVATGALTGATAACVAGESPRWARRKTASTTDRKATRTDTPSLASNHSRRARSRRKSAMIST
jgi:hypothetical protein